FAESHFLVAADRPDVGGEHPQVDPGKPHRPEGVLHQGPHGVGAVSLVPKALLADPDAQLRVAAAPGDVVQFNVTDEDVVVGGNGQVVAVPVALQPAVPLCVLFQACGVLAPDVAGDFPVAAPGGKLGKVGRPDRPEEDLLPANDHRCHSLRGPAPGPSGQPEGAPGPAVVVCCGVSGEPIAGCEAAILASGRADLQAIVGSAGTTRSTGGGGGRRSAVPCGRRAGANIPMPRPPPLATSAGRTGRLPTPAPLPSRPAAPGEEPGARWAGEPLPPPGPGR